MTAIPPAISAALREKTVAFAVHHSLVVDRVWLALVESDLVYGELSPVVKRDVVEHLRFSASLWFRSLLDGQFPADDKLEEVRSIGRRRVHQGVSLSSLMRAFRVGTREIWRLYLDLADENEVLRDELLFSISPYLLDFFDSMAQLMSQGYLEEQFQRTRWRDATRYELCNIVFSSPDDREAFEAAADALGIDASGLRIGMAIDWDSVDTMPSAAEGELDRFGLAFARHLKVPAEQLIRIMHHGHLVLWAPCVLGDSIVAADNRVAKQVGLLLSSVPRVHRVGIGLMNIGAAGWAASAAEAIKALELGRRSGANGVFTYSDIAVSESVLRSQNAVRYLNSLLAHLSHEPDLLATLETYFEQSQRRKTTSALLGIHPNTLTLRLERVEQLLGANLDEAGWIMRLEIALKLRRATSSVP